VCLTYRSDQAAASAVVAAVERHGGRAAAVRADVTVESDVVAAVEAATTLAPLGAVVANAGMVGEQTRVDQLTVERVERMLATNVTGAIVTCREAVRRLSTAHGGRGGAIVLVSSAAARLGSPGEYVDYAASKAAVDTLGLGLAKEVADEGVRVAVVRPGVIDTELHASGGQPDRVARLGPGLPMGRAGTPDEVAAAIVWLVSDEASYVTGSVLDVAGGR
jgi:NAD(P)-dependent dehydrogenase (short-subunit alcohol dehydrogenase family)